MTLEEAKRWLRGRVSKGARCPCCNQLAKIYRRKLNSSMSRAIILLDHAVSHWPENYLDLKRGCWVHADRIIRASSIRSHDYIGLSYWGLIIEGENEADGKKHSGWWRVSPRGHEFARNRLEVPSHAVIYNRKLLRLEGDPVGIVETLGKHFDYSELMAERPYGQLD